MRIASLLALTSCLALAACGTPMTKAPSLTGPVKVAVSAAPPGTMDLPIGSTILGDSPIIVRKTSSGTGLAMALGPLGVLAAHASLGSDAASAGKGVAIGKQEMVAALKKELDSVGAPAGISWTIVDDAQAASASTVKFNTFMALEVGQDNKMRSTVILRVQDASKGAANSWLGQYTYHDPLVIDDSNKQKELGEGLKVRMTNGLHQTVNAYVRDVRGELGAAPVEQTVFIDGAQAFGSVQPITLIETDAGGKSIYRAKCVAAAPLCYGVHILDKTSYANFSIKN